MFTCLSSLLNFSLVFSMSSKTFLQLDHDLEKYDPIDRQLSMIIHKMRRFILCLISIFIICDFATSNPLNNQRTFNEVPSIMEILARKMGIVKFFTNFVRGVKAMFGWKPRYFPLALK